MLLVWYTWVMNVTTIAWCMWLFISYHPKFKVLTWSWRWCFHTIQLLMSDRLAMGSQVYAIRLFWLWPFVSALTWSSRYWTKSLSAYIAIYKVVICWTLPLTESFDEESANLCCAVNCCCCKTMPYIATVLHQCLGLSHPGHKVFPHQCLVIRMDPSPSFVSP